MLHLIITAIKVKAPNCIIPTSQMSCYVTILGTKLSRLDAAGDGVGGQRPSRRLSSRLPAFSKF